MPPRHRDAPLHPADRLSEDERLLFSSVREFAGREVAPLVREMDEQARIPRALIDKLFGLGVMQLAVLAWLAPMRESRPTT